MSIETSYNRPVPTAWPDLVDRAATRLIPGLLMPGQEFPRAAQADILVAASRMDTNTRAENLYYGLGFGMVGINEVLQTEEGKNDTISDLRRRFAERNITVAAVLDPRPGERASGSSLFQAGKEVYGPLAGPSIERLSASQRLVVQGLTIAAQYIRLGGDVTGPDSQVRPQLIDHFKHKPAADLIGINSIAASVEMLYRAYQAQKQAGRAPDVRSLHSNYLLRLSAVAAGLHSNEFGNPAFMDRLLVADGQGNLRLDRTVKPEKPQVRIVAPGVDHTERQGCPVIQVGKLGLIDATLEIVARALGPAGKTV